MCVCVGGGGGGGVGLGHVCGYVCVGVCVRVSVREGGGGAHVGVYPLCVLELLRLWQELGKRS